MNATDTTGSDTPVRRQYRRLATLSRPETGLTDEERATRCERISLAVTALVATLVVVAEENPRRLPVAEKVMVEPKSAG